MNFAAAVFQKTSLLLQRIYQGSPKSFLNFEKNNIQTTFQNSEKWFGKVMPLDIIESNYLSIVRLDSKKSYVRFSIPVINGEECGVNVYNQFKERVNPDDIIPNTDVWVILRCKGLVMGKRNLCFEWKRRKHCN